MNSQVQEQDITSVLERHPLLKPSTTISNDHDDIYPPRAHCSHRHHTQKHAQHSPVPASVLFAKMAPPLHLPKLDDLLASLKPPPFSRSTEMFPPMDSLAKTGMSLDDLALNSKSGWLNRATVIGALVNFVVGFTGSSALSTFYSLQGLANTLQVFALILSTLAPYNRDADVWNHWKSLFLGTIPNILALNFASTALQTLILLLLFMFLTSFLLYYFYQHVFHCERYGYGVEGLQGHPQQGRGWLLLIITFILTVIYLPLSTMAISVLVWSSDIWIVPNPYRNATSLPPNLPPLGSPAQFRDPLDFCWTTTMKKNEVNWAPALVLLALIVVASMTIPFPLAIHRVIKQSVPRVDKFNEMGRRRTSLEKDMEYRRRLSRDTSPFTFLYNGFRRGCATFQSQYLLAKLSSLVIITFLDANNCLFRSVPSPKMVLVARNIVLFLCTIIFFIQQCLATPFLGDSNNAQEWVSRLSFVLTSGVSLALAVDVPANGKYILENYIIYILYIFTYSFTFYFTIINQSFVHRIVKRLTRRLDFSIDIFSPRLDTHHHIRRRIWQESVTALILTDSSTKIPLVHAMQYAESRELIYPPYLLNFEKTPGERHVENLKILRDVGGVAYYKAVALTSGPDHNLYQRLSEEIQLHYVGPDSFWKDSIDNSQTCTFGTAWWIPFPPTLVIRFDDQKHATLRDTKQWEEYIRQNSSPTVQRARDVRMVLRALEGERVFWPYRHLLSHGAHPFWHGAYSANSSQIYQSCELHIHRSGHLIWEGLHFGSGFDIELRYSSRVRVKGDVIGLTDDFSLTEPLARFFSLNRDTIVKKLASLNAAVSRYRHHHFEECHRKVQVLGYNFLTQVYDCPQDLSIRRSKSPCYGGKRIQRLLNDGAMTVVYERYSFVASSQLRMWWYLFWDDLFRRNHRTVSALIVHKYDFNPHYPSSIAYTPLPRAVLERFLIQRGLLSAIASSRDILHTGWLNRIYARLNEAAFRETDDAMLFHVGGNEHEMDMDSVDTATLVNTSTLGTGGGTNHDDSVIMPRPHYRWEDLMEEPERGWLQKQTFVTKLGSWVGLTPFWTANSHFQGLSVDVILDEKGRYVML